jgi:DNA-binding MarR family transcriptional regulator
MSQSFDPSATTENLVRSIDRTMSRLRRNLSRRIVGRLALRDVGLAAELAHLDVVEAVVHPPEGDRRPATVGVVAERLGIDPSRASRIVADAVRVGIVRRAASQDDARRVGIELTPKGRAVVESLLRHRAAVFDEAMRDWEPSEIAVFAPLLERFVTTLDEVVRRAREAGKAADAAADAGLATSGPRTP